MDDNKAAVMRQIGYQIQRSCGLCVFMRFTPTSQWGTCRANKYKHGKHTGAEREMSVHRSGICGKFQPDKEVIANDLGDYSEFMDA